MANPQLWMDELSARYAHALFGGVPAGTLFGMPLFINYDMPNDRIRVVNPATGEVTEIVVPSNGEA